MHPNVVALLEARAGRPPARLLVDIDGTDNQERVYAAAGLEQVAQGFAGLGPHGTPAAIDRTVRYATVGFERDRTTGLMGGESLATYAGLHVVGAVGGFDAVLRLRARFPEHPGLLGLHALQIGWLRFVGGLCVAWRNGLGIVRCVLSRYKHGPIDTERNLRGGDVLGDHFLAPAGGPELARYRADLHPELRDRLGRPLNHPTFDHAEHDRVLIGLLRSPVGTYLRSLGHLPIPVGRLTDEVHYRRDGEVLEVLAPVVHAKKDDDGRTKQVEEFVRWSSATGTYEGVRGRTRIGKGANVCWYEKDIAGRLVDQIWFRGIQGVRAGEPLPIPRMVEREGSGWRLLGPSSPPFPLPEPRSLVIPDFARPGGPGTAADRRPADVTWEWLSERLSTALVVIRTALDLAGRWENDRLGRAAVRFHGDDPVAPSEITIERLRQRRLATVALVASAMVVVDDGWTTDPELVAAVADLRRDAGGGDAEEG
jgi:hypothetical protein